MPRSSSTSFKALEDLRKRFKDSLAKDVASLVKLHRNDERSRGPRGLWLRAIRRSAIVLATAALESFLEESVCTAITHLHDRNLPAAKFPSAYRAWLLSDGVNSKAYNKSNVTEVADLVRCLWSDAETIPKNRLRLKALREKFDNPTPAQVDFLASLFGFEDYSEKTFVMVLGKKTSLKAGLNELLERRNKIAHGDQSQNPKLKEDVVRLAKFSKLLGTRFSSDIGRETSRILGCQICFSRPNLAIEEQEA